MKNSFLFQRRKLHYTSFLFRLASCLVPLCPNLLKEFDGVCVLRVLPNLFVHNLSIFPNQNSPFLFLDGIQNDGCGSRGRDRSLELEPVCDFFWCVLAANDCRGVASDSGSNVALVRIQRNHKKRWERGQREREKAKKKSEHFIHKAA